jgi:hypothetical protein
MGGTSSSTPIKSVQNPGNKRRKPAPRAPTPSTIWFKKTPLVLPVCLRSEKAEMICFLANDKPIRAVQIVNAKIVKDINVRTRLNK